MASHLRYSMASDFQSSLARAIKQFLNCAVIKEARLRRHKANLLAPLYLLRFPLKKYRHYRLRKAVMPIIVREIIANYLIIRVFIGGGVGIINNETSKFFEKLPKLPYVITLLFIPQKHSINRRKYSKYPIKAFFCG